MRSLFFIYLTAAVVAVLSLGLGCGSSGGGGGGSIERADINEAKSAAHAANASGEYMATVELMQPLLDRAAAQEQRIIDHQVYSLLAIAYWKLGAFDQALPNFEQALRLTYGSAEDHLKFGEMLMEMGKVGRALTEFELAVRFDAGDPLSHYNYGLALYQFGRPDAALAEWGMAHTLDRTNAQYAEALGIGYSERDDAKAFEYFGLAKELGSDSPQYHNNFGVLLQRMGRIGEAEAEFREAANFEPANAEYRGNLVAAYMAGQKYDTAIPLLVELISEEPDQRRHRIYLANAYYAEARYREVVELLDPWVDSQSGRRKRGEVGPGMSEAFDTLAMSHRELGDLQAALPRIEKAVALAPDNTVHLNNYGVILAENGRIDEAKAQWERVLQLEPDNAAARQNLSAFAR